MNVKTGPDSIAFYGDSLAESRKASGEAEAAPGEVLRLRAALQQAQGALRAALQFHAEAATRANESAASLAAALAQTSGLDPASPRPFPGHPSGCNAGGGGTCCGWCPPLDPHAVRALSEGKRHG